MAMPRHDASWFDGKLAEPELALLDVCRLLFEIEGGKHGVGNTLARVGNRLAAIRFHLTRRATAGKRRRHPKQGRSGSDAGKNEVPAEASATGNAIEHDRGSPRLGRARTERR